MSDSPGIGDIHEDAPDDKPEVEQQQPQPQPQAQRFKSKAVDAWTEYYDNLGVDRKKEIEQLAKLLEYEVSLQPLYDDHNNLIKEDEIRVFRRRKISTKDYLETEQMRVTMKMSKNPQEVHDTLVKLYKRMGFFYLEDKKTGQRMTEEEFYRCDWVPIKNILDAANLHSTFGKLPLEMTK